MPMFGPLQHFLRGPWASRSLARFGGVNYDVGVVVRAFLPQAHFSQAQGADLLPHLSPTKINYPFWLL